MTNYYVATTENDANSGTLASPWLTLQHAADTMVAGNTAIVFAGEYDKFTIATSGNISNYITFKADDLNNKPMVKGTNADILDSTAATWANSLSKQNFSSAIQSNTVFLSQHIFVNGISNVSSIGNYTLEDLILVYQSAVYNNAQPLTLVNGTQTSTILALVDAGMIFCGNPQLNENEDLLRIGTQDVSVNYDTNTISLYASITVNNNDPVFYRDAIGISNSVGGNI